MVPIHYTAVLIAAVVAFIIGFLMHGPVGGKLWTKLAGITPTGTEKFSQMIPQMLGNLVTFFITAWAVAVIYGYAAASAYATPGAHTGMMVAVLAWFGFLVTASFNDVLWMGKKKGLWMYEAFSSLLVMLAIGAIIAQ